MLLSQIGHPLKLIVGKHHSPSSHRVLVKAELMGSGWL